MSQRKGKTLLVFAAARVRKAGPDEEPAKGEPPAPLQRRDDGVLAVYLRSDVFRDFTELRKVQQALAKELPQARAVVVDLRARGGETYQPAGFFGGLNPLFASRPLRLPAQRYLVHSGYRGQTFQDMRGYPRGTAWAIAPRLNTRGAIYGATFRRAEVSAIQDSDLADTGFYFSQPLPVSSQWKYTGKTVMLIDERAISQSEHSGLFYEAANGTKFVGAPSAGANGDVTDLTLPGGIGMYFTGHDVRHADGRQLQRVGLVPDVLVAPTLQGLRDGRDEVLDRAMAELNQELAENRP